MSDQTNDTPYYQGRQSGSDKDKGCDPPPPPPPPPPCPDPCDEEPPWGPPDIRPECCPDERECCPNDQNHYCSWDEVDDPCVRASSCGGLWTKITCKCESSNEKCKCDEWDCGSYPQGTCVPCYPCEGMFPEEPNEPPEEPTDGSEEPTGDGCADDLRRQLIKTRKEIIEQQKAKADAEANIKTKQEIEKELATLVDDFTKIINKYRDERPKLVCKEDCLKGFHRDISKVFADRHTFPQACLEDFRNAINTELCKLEKAKCCQKNLEEKLEKITKLIWEQQQAQKASEKAADAFKNIKDFPKWVADQFDPLEKLKDKITAALKDPLQQRWAFYLFYWHFVPGLCKRFPIAICCKPKETPEARSQSHEESSDHIGCERGDWHPSVITVEKLTKLLCCAAESAQSAKDELEAKKSAVEKVKANLVLIKEKIKTDTTALEDSIKSQLNKVECKPVASSS